MNAHGEGQLENFAFYKSQSLYKQTRTLGNENAYSAERNKNVNKHICTNKHKHACIHMNTHTDKQM